MKPLTLNAQSEFHHRQTNQIASLFDTGTFSIPPIYTQNTWRHYSTKGKPPIFDDNDNDNLHEGDEFELIDESDDDADIEDEDIINQVSGKKNSVPSTNTVPDYFPKVPMIATPFPVFPKFMKVFEVTDPNLIKLLEWVKLNMQWRKLMVLPAF